MRDSKRLQSRFIDPETLARISSLDLIAKAVVEGFLSGLHRSPFHGHSAEFAEYRAYNPGDDARRIDWRVYARTDRYYVKRFEEETDLDCYFLIDTSGSMADRPAALSKLDYARYLAAALAYLVTVQRDRICLLSVSDRVRQAIPPGGGHHHLQMFLRRLERLAAEGPTDLKASLMRADESFGRRSLVILISDLYDDEAGVARTLSRLRRAGHEVIVFHLLDSVESKLLFDGPVELEDLETGARVQIDAARDRAAYIDRLDTLISFYNRELSRVGIDFVSLDTSRPLDAALLAYLRRRRAMRR